MFPVLGPSEVERLRRFGRVRSYAPGEALAKAGEAGHGLAIVLTGTVEITRRDGSASGVPIAVSREVVPYLAWPGLAQVARIERRREIARKASTEIIYLITSLPPETASPERLLRLARDHWDIENKLHYVRDVTFAEDRCRVRAGARPLAALRNLAITLIR